MQVSLFSVKTVISTFEPFEQDNSNNKGNSQENFLIA